MATSSAVKYKYNKKTYKQWNVQIKPELFGELNGYCEEHGLSRSQFLELALKKLSGE